MYLADLKILWLKKIAAGFPTQKTRKLLQDTNFWVNHNIN